MNRLALLPAFALAGPFATAQTAPVQVEFSTLRVLSEPPAPAYPTVATMARVQGTVVLEVTIGPNGRPEQTDFIEGPALLRAAAEADIVRWVFAPVLVGGKPARVRTLFAVPFALDGAGAPEPGRGIDQVVLQCVLAPTIEAAPMDLGILELEARAGLARAGLRVVDPATADPARTLFIKLTLQAERTYDGLACHDVSLRSSLLADRETVQNEPGRPQKVMYCHFTGGRKGTAGFQEELCRTVRQAMFDLLIFPAAPETEQDRALRAALAGPGLDAKGRPMEVDFTKVKVRQQPAPPSYPWHAGLNGVAGDVVLLITVDPEGRPTRAEALSGPPELYMTAIRYALKWEFEPALLNGVPQTARFRLNLPFRFRMGALPPPRGRR